MTNKRNPPADRPWTTPQQGLGRLRCLLRLSEPPNGAAANWALPRLTQEHRAILERARAGYCGKAENFWDDIRPQVRAYADHVVSENERALTETDRST